MARSGIFRRTRGKIPNGKRSIDVPKPIIIDTNYRVGAEGRLIPIEKTYIFADGTRKRVRFDLPTTGAGPSTSKTPEVGTEDDHGLSVPPAAKPNDAREDVGPQVAKASKARKLETTKLSAIPAKLKRDVRASGSEMRNNLAEEARI